MSSAHNRYNALFRQTHETQMIHHLTLLLLKNKIMIQAGTLQRIHRQYIRYESVLDDRYRKFKFWIFDALYIRSTGIKQILRSN